MYTILFFFFFLAMLDPNEDNAETKMFQAIGWTFTSFCDTMALYWASHRYIKILGEVERQPLLPQ